MHLDRNQIERLISELQAVRQSAFWLEGEREAWLSKVCDAHRESARNLLHYLALRRRDLRPLQDELSSLGLSSLGRSESHVLGTIESVLEILTSLLGEPFEPGEDGIRAVQTGFGESRLTENSDALFGSSGDPSQDSANPIRVMVTMPTEAATSYEFVEELVRSGMDCMRINCSHDTPVEWAAMIENLKRATAEMGRNCRVQMDLGGPKLRTGMVELGPRVVRWEPKHDPVGTLVRPATIWMTPVNDPEGPPPSTSAIIPLKDSVLETLEIGDELTFRDLRGRRRTVRIASRIGSSVLGESDQITYLGAETKIKVRRLVQGAESDAAEVTDVESDEAPRPNREVVAKFTPDTILPREQHLDLRAGDQVIISLDPVIARPVERDRFGEQVEIPVIACILPEAFADAKPGESILFDDGKIGGVIDSIEGRRILVRVESPVVGTKKIRSYKGINLPETHLVLPALTTKDLEDLDFVAQHADIVGLSFVNRPQDVEELQREILRRTSRPIGICLKIETRRAFDQLPRILLAAMRTERVGVMIARGDLAVECGYQRLAELQEEILWICEAAHVPVIWATQVLDRLSKKGQPTRAEITDAALSERAECVMLNKGPHIAQSVRVLRDIVGRMQGHRSKKVDRLRPLSVSLLPDPED